MSTDTITYSLWCDQDVYAGQVEIAATEPAPPMSSLDAPADPSKVGRYQRVDGSWKAYKEPKPDAYQPEPDPFASAEDAA